MWITFRSVLAWRKWYHKQGQGGYWRATGRPATRAPDLTREQLLDRFHQHTQHCPSCSKVLAQLPLQYLYFMVAAFRELAHYTISASKQP
jgi:hypothetical protein